MFKKILAFVFLAGVAFGQTTYTASRYKQVWYVPGTEKIHATFAAYDTSSLKIDFDTNVPILTQYSATGAILFQLSKTGTFSYYAGSATPPWFVATLFDDSLNNPHTITNQWGFTGGIRVAEDIYPTTNYGADLGRTSYKFDSLYAGYGKFYVKLEAPAYGSDGTVSDAELLYINSLSSNAQTQLTLRSDTTVAIRADLNERGYTLNLIGTYVNAPADASTYYWGGIAGLIPSTTNAIRKLYIPMAGRIKAAQVIQYCDNVNASGENITVNIRLNDTSDTAVATIGNTTAWKTFTNYALDIAVAQGDFIEIKCVYPTWATNPDRIQCGGSIFIQQNN